MLFKMKKMLSPIAQEKGFSLVEVLMATLILTIGILAYGKTSNSIMGTNTVSKKESVAITLAQDLIEEYKNTGLPASADWVDTEVVNVEGETSGSQPTIYTRSWVITNPSANLWDVAVTVAWTNMTTRSVTLNTRISTTF